MQNRPDQQSQVLSRIPRRDFVGHAEDLARALARSSKSSGGALIHELPEPKDEEPENQESLSGGVGLPMPAATKAAKKSQGRGEKTES